MFPVDKTRKVETFVGIGNPRYLGSCEATFSSLHNFQERDKNINKEGGLGVRGVM